MKDHSEVEKNIGVKFRDQDLLTQALVHRSYLNEHPGFALGHNERLEFLGDAVLELVVTRHLFDAFPDKPEGELTNWRASLVKSQTLADAAEALNLYDSLHLSRGEARDTNEKARRYIIANAYEAVIGAIYMDQDYDQAKDFIHRTLLPKLEEILEHKLYLDPKSRFQEKAQEIESITPRYQVMEESGPDHAKEFVIGVYLDNTEIARGRGASKHEAEENAARAAIQAKDW
ncbi:MAG: ribonuclease III [bacterium]|nr:ribonuclease III [bacterium]